MASASLALFSGGCTSGEPQADTEQGGTQGLGAAGATSGDASSGATSAGSGGAGGAAGASNTDTGGNSSGAGGQETNSGGESGSGGGTGGAEGGTASDSVGGNSAGGDSAGGAGGEQNSGAGTSSADDETAGSGGSAEDGGAGQSEGGSGGQAEGGGAFDAPFFLGADISSVQEGNLTFVDTDGETKSIFELLKNHGFNYIRVKAFVDPTAPYGYASTENGCSGLPEPFGDKAHVIEFGQQIKAAGMGFLLDFHYSDVWADPGNQIIPDAWRAAATIEELAEYLAAYTTDVLSDAIAANARPDMVQIGNEITPGVLVHVPGPDTDCWGNNPRSAPIGGGTSNWDNLGTLLRAGADAVRAVDPDIQVMLHVENTDDLDGVRWWVDNAFEQGVDFDVLGLSCYTAFQGQPAVWENTFNTLAQEHPSLRFVIAEYNPARTEANLAIKNMPNGQGLGTFFWEPTRSGEWGDAMFTFQGNTARANEADFAEYDAMLPMLGLD